MNSSRTAAVNCESHRFAGTLLHEGRDEFIADGTRPTNERNRSIAVAELQWGRDEFIAEIWRRSSCRVAYAP